MLKLKILTPKGTSLRDAAHFEPSRVKIVKGFDLFACLRKK